MNRSIPRTGLLIPPWVSWGIEASGLCSTGSAAGSVVIDIARSVLRRPAVADVEQRTLGADLRQMIEVVRRRRRGGRPLERIPLPGVVAGDRSAAERQEDVPEEHEHARGDREPADSGEQ